MRFALLMGYLMETHVCMTMYQLPVGPYDPVTPGMI